ncbi:MAG: tRNA (adenosine(37)-N6)-threonylcarbamoyltransferase complex ATPase subunit type 1 TsaE [Candidatus Calescibacterium sp.]|nr:tRNA (adenosine(37)-N6)-threonylcarbamoyltransferase complex ATPase subunit type 1 TsaE [Candidatus Calescibacterium sp.]
MEKIKKKFISFLSESPDETKSIAEKIISEFSKNRVFLLFGEIGSGKTTFIKGVAKKLGIDEDAITSPTFSISQEYWGEEKNIVHIDLYRLENKKEIEEVVNFICEKYKEDKNSLIFIEWAEKLEEYEKLLPESIKINLKFGKNETQREIEVISE